MIEDGRVEVNGRLVSALPAFIDPRSDRVVVDGRPIDPRTARANRVYLILNKPDNTLTSTRDDGGERARTRDDAAPTARDSRRTVLDLIDHPAKARLFPVGRLDFHATGMVLLTNDGQLAQRLTHARYGVTKTYRITVRGRLHAEAIEALTRRFCPPPETMAALFPPPPSDDFEPSPPPEPLTIIARKESGTTFDLVMRAGAGAGSAKPVRGLRRPGEEDPAAGRAGDLASLSATKALVGMLQKMGNPVKRIHRTAIGPLTMRYVDVGTARPLREEEVDLLRVAAGLQTARPGRPNRKPARVQAGPPRRSARTAQSTPARGDRAGGDRRGGDRAAFGRPSGKSSLQNKGQPGGFRAKSRSTDAPRGAARPARGKPSIQRPNNPSKRRRPT